MDSVGLSIEVSNVEYEHLLALKASVDSLIERRKKSQKAYYIRNSEKIKARAAEWQRAHYVHKRSPNAIVVA